MCTSPILIKNNRLDFNPNVMRRFYSVPCGKCAQCRDNYRNEYSSRISQEMFEATGDNVFLVLTYNNEHLPRTFRGRYPCFNQEHIKALMKMKILFV